MALFVPLAQGVQVELVYRLAGRILCNRLWFVVVAGDPTTTDLTNIGDGVRTWASTQLMPNLSSDIRLLTIRAYDATVPYPGPQVALGAGVNGGSSSGSYSANVAAKFSFQTQTPPALWLNWNFIGGIPDDAVDLNRLDPGWVSDIRDAYIVLLDVFSLFVYRWEATRAFLNGVQLSTRDHFRIDHIQQRTGLVSQRRTRLNNPF